MDERGIRCGSVWLACAAVAIAAAACSFDDIGPDLDAWQAAKAASDSLSRADGATADAGAEVAVDAAGDVPGDAGTSADADAADDATSDGAGDLDTGGQGDVDADGTSDSEVGADGDLTDTAGDGDVAADADADSATDGTDAGADSDAGAKPCKDKSECTTSDPCVEPRCEKGACDFPPKSNPAPPPACQTATCVDGAFPVALVPSGVACDDGLPCTVSACNGAGTCFGVATVCQDGVACTNDMCDAILDKCVFPTDVGACDDKTVCTLDVCDVKAGACSHKPAANGLDCLDDDKCFATAMCSDGKCTTTAPKSCGAPAGPCETSVCIKQTGSCGTAAAPDFAMCPGGQGQGNCLGGKCGTLFAKSIALGSKHGCAIGVALSQLSCWGSNATLAYAPPSEAGAYAAKAVATVMPVAAVAAGAGFTCLLTTGGGVACRGQNDVGQSGKAPGPPVIDSFNSVALAAKASQIAAGASHACALVNDGGSGKVYCWGEGNDGQLGPFNPTKADSAMPLEVSGFGGAVQAIAAGGGTTCALVAGFPFCWGAEGVAWADAAGTPKVGTPAAVKGVSGLSQICLGAMHGCGVTGDGKVVCWGSNTVGQLGTEPSAAVKFAVTTWSDKKVLAIGCGDWHQCLLVAGADGAPAEVICLGNNGKLQSGDAAGKPVALPGTPKAVAAGGMASCALMWNGSVVCWGAPMDTFPMKPTVLPGSEPQFP